MKIKSTLYLFLFVFACLMNVKPVTAQFESYQSLYYTQHRPAGLNWQQLKTPHFRIIYPLSEDSLAYRAAKILEQQYPITQNMTGGELNNFPIILSNYNDLSNGFVTPINFRSEFDIAPFKGKAINPASGDWFEAVLPHELLHANHGNVRVKWSISSLYGLLSPDLARTFNFFPPVGVHEGLAVYHESKNVTEHGGRENYSYFTNQFNAKLSSDAPWSAGQTFSTSTYQLPGNRHYVAGSGFTNWLHQNYGEDVSKRAIRYHLKYFFLGYGFALKQTTGKWPKELHEEYVADQKRKEQLRKKDISETTSEKHQLIPSPYKGVLQHKPIWTTQETLLYYSLHFNAPRGFYTYNLNTNKTKKIAEINTVGDYNIDYDRTLNSLLFSEYDANLIYPSAFKSELKRIDLNNKKQFEITSADRVYSPTASSDVIIALQTNGSDADVIAIDSDKNKTVLATFKDSNPVAIKANPNQPKQLALIINKRGTQALWITTPSSIAQDVKQSPRVAFKNGSIFDLDWHPTEQKLLFTADNYPAMNIYELNLSNGDILQKTNSLYNVYEASYSPDASAIAYVTQQPDQQQKIAILKKEDYFDRRVERDALLFGIDLKNNLHKNLLGVSFDDKAKEWKSSKYGSDLSWLKPRAVLPVIRENANTTQFGVNAQSVDALSSQSYSAEITGIQNRLWYNVAYTNKTFWPGFKVSAYSDPNFGILNAGGNQISVMQQERGFNLSVPMNFTINGTTRGKSFYIEPRFTAEQFRYFDLSPEPISDFETQYKAGGFTQFSWNVLSQRRDVQPTHGISVFGFLDKALNDQEITLDLGGGNSGRLSIVDRWAAFYGVIGYIAPLKRLNQSMRVDLQFLNQSDFMLYNVSTIVPESFTDNAFIPQNVNQDSFNNLGRFSTRYAIPIAYPGDGGMLVPFYLQSIYLTAFSHTITDMEQNGVDNLLNASRSVFGGGIHFQFNISNIRFDFGLGLSYEPTRNNTKFVFGTF